MTATVSLGRAILVGSALLLACTDEFESTTPVPIVVARAAGWPDTLLVDDDTTVSVTIQLEGTGATLGGTSIQWTSSDPAALELRSVQASDAGLSDSLHALLQIRMLAHHAGSIVVSALVQRAGLETGELVDTLFVLTRWKAIAAGGFHSCALTVHSEAFCWGGMVSNEDGPAGGMGIGDGLATGQPVPTALLAAPLFQTISAGRAHSCSTASPTGLAYCWGKNANGQLHDGSTTDQLTAVRVLSGRTATSIATGWNTTCLTYEPGIIAPGGGANVECFGSMDLANWTLSSGLFQKYSQISIGFDHACGLTGFQIVCQGANDRGQLGNNDSTPTTRPVRISSDSSFVAVSAGFRSTCALSNHGQVYCWGDNTTGQLGVNLPDSTRLLTPHLVSLADSAIGVYAAGSQGHGPPLIAHACAVTWKGEAYCWGSNSIGQLGIGTFGRNFPQPQRVVSPADGPVSWSSLAVAAGDPPLGDDGGRPIGHTCGLTTRGSVYCWGVDYHGQLGNGSRISTPTPTRVAEP